jgi:hypothetical protein
MKLSDKIIDVIAHLISLIKRKALTPMRSGIKKITEKITAKCRFHKIKRKDC